MDDLYQQLLTGPVLVEVTCKLCAKTWNENPWSAPPYRGEHKARAEAMLFNHGWKQHRSNLAALIPDKERRAELIDTRRR